MPCHRTSPGRTMGKRPLWVVHVDSGLSAFGGIADMNSWGKVAMGHKRPLSSCPRQRCRDNTHGLDE
jgi:hypothetical protein